jgi:hypothetical protein
MARSAIASARCSGRLWFYSLIQKAESVDVFLEKEREREREREKGRMIRKREREGT